ncbi:MAG TPA: outer membrane beta-barrel protein [Gemmatimonadales bacterium]|nr:outer membrane beta-barrel protein [Gemmatimonadales bacterium]
MKRFLTAVAGLALATAVAGSTAEAQSTRPVSIGVAGGIALPMGDFGDFFKSGYAVTGSVGFRPASVPFGIRGEVGYQSHDADGADATWSILSGTANAVFNFGSGASGVSPYFIAGVGMYRSTLDMSGFGSDSETDFGFNGGVGMDFALSGFNTFVEARYHHVLTEDEATTFIPITFGIRF